MNFQFINFWKYTLKILPFIKITFAYVCAGLALGLILGAVIACFKISKNKILKWVGVVYTAIFRSIPPVVLLFLVFYGVPAILHTDSQNRLLYVIITLTLLTTAEVSEVMRSAYSSVPKGQYEAAVTSGLSSLQALYRIVIPQAFFYALPNFASIIISLLKNGSLAFTIGLLDVFGKAMTLNNATYSRYILELYLSVTLIYWGISFLIESFFKLLEKKLKIDKGEKK